MPFIGKAIIATRRHPLLSKQFEEEDAVTSKPKRIFPNPRPARLKQVGKAMAAISLIAAALLVLFLFRAYRESQAVRAYVGGPFSSQLLYVQGCAPGAAGGGGQGNAAETLQEQFDSCRRPFGGRPGYYIYDFNIKKSVALSDEDMANLRMYEIFRFPSSILGKVEKSQTNPFNTIVPLEDFPGFSYSCVFDKDRDETSCSVAPLQCDVSGDAIQCNVYNPDTDSFERHAIKRDKSLDLLIPQGFIDGPDLYKLMKPSFFPTLDRLGRM